MVWKKPLRFFPLLSKKHLSWYGWKKLRSTNPGNPKVRLFICNCFELFLDWLPQPIRGQLKTITRLWDHRTFISSTMSPVIILSFEIVLQKINSKFKCCTLFGLIQIIGLLHITWYACLMVLWSSQIYILHVSILSSAISWSTIGIFFLSMS